MDTQSQEQLNVYQRILNIMADIDYIQKGSAKVNGQYAFVSHDQVTAKIHPLLVKYRVLMIPTVKSHIQEGNRTVLDLIVHFVNVDKPEDQFSINTFGYGVDTSDKGPGKALSYAFKIACLKAFCLETGEDSDNEVNAKFEPPKCLEFDLLIPASFTESEKKKLHKFLAESAEAHGKHIEEIKTKAAANMDQFLEVFKKWNGKK